MKNLRIGVPISNRINRSGVIFGGQVFRFNKNREFGFSPIAGITDFEPEQRVSSGVKRVCLVNRITGEIGLNIWPNVKTARCFIHQVRFINVDWNCSQTVVAINRIVLKMKIVEYISLGQGHALPGFVLFLFGIIVRRRGRLQCPDGRARDVDIAPVNAVRIIKILKFVMYPRMIKRQIPIVIQTEVPIGGTLLEL